MHGFANASQKAYAAAVYVKTVINETAQINLLLSKTKDNMLAKLIHHLKGQLNSFTDQTHK